MPLNRVQFDSNNNVNVVGGLTAPNLVARQGTTGPINLSSSPSVLGTGMDLITPASVVNATLSGGEISFSATNSISVNRCFSSTYDNYYISLECASDLNNTLQFRMRSNGLDATGATDYGYTGWFAGGGNTSGILAASVGSSSALFSFTGLQPDRVGLNLNVYSPAIAQYTTITGIAARSTSGVVVLLQGASHKVNAAHDGFTLSVDGGISKITGKLRIYGLRNS